MGNVLLASLLGSAITSAPKIWDLIAGSPTDQTKRVDPVTGKPLPTADDQKAASAAGKLKIGQLSDVNDTNKKNLDVLVYDAASGIWVTKNLHDLLESTGALSGDTVCGGDGGNGGDGGHGGSGGDGGNGGSGSGSTTPTPPCEPYTSYTQVQCNTPPAVTKSGMQLLPSLLNTTNNEYSQLINVLGTKGIELHFHASGNGLTTTYNVANGSDENCATGGELSCLTDKEKGEQEAPPSKTVSYQSPGSFQIRICLTITLCGTEYLFYTDSFSNAGLSTTSYTFKHDNIMFENTDLGHLITKYPGQIINQSNPNIKLYLQRLDQCGSQYDLYFEGYKKILGETYTSPVQSPRTSKTSKTTAMPLPIEHIVDDGKWPDTPPGGGSLHAPACPITTVLPTDPTLGQPGQPGGAGSSGTPGTDGSCGSVTVNPAPAQPSISLGSPCAKNYGEKTIPPEYDKVQLPSIILDTGITDQSCEVTYTVTKGTGEFYLDGAPSGSSTVSIGINSATISGLKSDVETTGNQMYFIPEKTYTDQVDYTVTIKNAEDTVAGTGCSFIPKNVLIVDNVGAKGKICIASSTTAGSGKIKVDVNGTIKDLTNGFVPFNTTIAQTASDIAANINSNIAIKNALDVEDPLWLPAYGANASGNTINILAPVEGGADFNDVQLSTETSGAFVFEDCGGNTLLGGVTKTINDFLKNNIPNWDKVSDVLMGVGGNVLGAVITNVIMNNASQVQISIPSTESVEIYFLYRGRKISIPTEYDGLARTGHPTHSSWGGTFKTAYTNNPAWVVYDYITNKKYGLGNVIKMSTSQQTALLKDVFEIGLYCDNIITNDDATTEPRYSINTVITDGTRLQILEQLCSVFLGGYYWDHGGLRLTYDHLVSGASFIVNQANGTNFAKDFSSASNFINKVKSTYIEPSNFYQESVVVAENDSAIDIYGERAIDDISFGITSVNQAKRRAKWILDSEFKNKTVINYVGGIDHYNLKVGDIVLFHDNMEGQTTKRAGRILSHSGNQVTLDRVPDSITDPFNMTLSDGTVFTSNISSISGQTITLSSTPSVSALPYATWIMIRSDLPQLKYKVIKCLETDPGKYSVTLQRYSPDKY